MSLLIPHFRAVRALTSFAPTDIGVAKLRFWTTPEASAWTTSARTTLETGTGLIGAKDDVSGNAVHALQATAGTRPTRKTNGGFRCNGTSVATVALTAWAGDFDVWLVIKNNTFTSNYRVAEVDYATGFGVLQSGTDRVKFAVAASASPYGFDSATALTTIHVVHCWRVGTTASIAVDGAAPATTTVTGSALANGAFVVGLSAAGSFGADVDHHEIAVCAAITSGERASMDAYFAARLTSGIYV